MPWPITSQRQKERMIEEALPGFSIDAASIPAVGAAGWSGNNGKSILDIYYPNQCQESDQLVDQLHNAGYRTTVGVTMGSNYGITIWPKSEDPT